MRLGNIVLPRTAALAPMAGFADRAFREVCAGMGACYVVGEMTSAKGLCYGSSKSAELLEVSAGERPMAVQLFGAEPGYIGNAVKRAMRYNPDAIDINMGCPAPKITGGGAGSALMRDLTLAGEVIRAAVEASAVPVTVKMRKGWDGNDINAVELAVIAEKAGAAAVTVHGRTREQMYAPPADLDIIKRVREAVSIPVIGNGDVASVEDAIKMYGHTDCALVMIGRGALGRPWVFSRIKAYMERGEKVPEPPLEEKLRIMLGHIKLACEYKGEYAAMREARSHAAWYLKGIYGAASFRRLAGELRVYEDLEALARRVLDYSVKRREEE